MFGVWGLLRQLALEGLGSLLVRRAARDRDEGAGRAGADYIILYACAHIVVTARAVFTFIMYM